LSSTIHVPDSQLKEYIEISTEYAVLLFSVVLCVWEIMVEGFKAKKTGTCDYKKMKDRIMQYDKLWSEYRKLKETHPCCATLYEGRSLAVPYEKTIPGLDAAVDECRQHSFNVTQCPASKSKLLFCFSYLFTFILLMLLPVVQKYLKP